MQAKTGEPPEKAPKMSATGAAPAPAKPVGDARRAIHRLPDARCVPPPCARRCAGREAHPEGAAVRHSVARHQRRVADLAAIRRAGCRQTQLQGRRARCLPCGQSAGDAIARAVDAGVDGIIDLGETGGHGVPMSGWVKSPGPPKDDGPDDNKHFFKGSAADTFRRWIRRGASVADAVRWAVRQDEPDRMVVCAQSGVSALGAEVPRPPT